MCKEEKRRGGEKHEILKSVSLEVFREKRTEVQSAAVKLWSIRKVENLFEGC